MQDDFPIDLATWLMLLSNSRIFLWKLNMWAEKPETEKKSKCIFSNDFNTNSPVRTHVSNLVHISRTTTAIHNLSLNSVKSWN